jgi:glycosyltransferase involved in cell wall biosynthesis
MIRIGIDGSCVSAKLAGIGRYVFELCKALDKSLPHARFFVYSAPSVNLSSLSDRWTCRTHRQLYGPFSRTRSLIKYVPKYCVEDCLDIFWAAATPSPALPAHIRTVVTVHDLNHILVPHTMCRWTLWEQRLFFRASLKRASAITTNSAGTAYRLFRLLGFRTAAIVTPGVSSVFHSRDQRAVESCRRSYGIHSPYLLAVATKEPRKNLELLVRTFLRMKKDGLLKLHRLVLVGDSGWANASLMRLLNESPRDLVMSLSYVPDDDLSALYCASDALVFPSIYEGFGMPLIEARACGTRVVCTDLPELREAGGPDGVYISPTETGIREGIISCLKRARPAPAEKTQLPSWTAAAAAMSNVFLEAMEMHFGA